MKVQKTLNPDHITTPNHIPFHDVAVTVEPFSTIPSGTVFLVLQDILVFFLNNDQNRVVSAQWTNDLRQLKCRRLQPGESFTVTIE